MPSYMYPITIYRYKKLIRVVETVYINEITETEELSNLVGDNKFTLTGAEDGSLELEIYHDRFETTEEYESRIERDEEYMRNYNYRKEKPK